MAISSATPARFSATSGSLKAMMLLLSFMEGAAVMIAELVGAKMLAPVHGSSLHVWGAIIGVSLTALTAGYFLGGILSHRRQRRAILYWAMTLAAFLIAAMPALANALMFAFEDMGAVPAVLLLALLLLFLPLLCLGAASPLIIGIISERIEHAGRAAGTVYAVSTTGGILATFLCGFYFIPEYGLTATAQTTGLVLMVLPLGLLLGRGHVPALALPILALLLMAPEPLPSRPSPVQVLYQSEGLLGQLIVADVPMGRQRTDRILFVNRMAQTWVNTETGQPVWDYYRYLKSVASALPEGARALLLGLGGGILARELQAIGFQVDGVELDARIARIAETYFHLQPKGELHVDDGRHFLRTTDRQYDLVIFDVFKAEIPPPHLLTLEAFREARQLLAPGGFLVINFNGFLEGELGYPGRSILKTLEAAGLTVHILPTPGEEDARNNIFIATPDARDFATVRAPLSIDGRQAALPDLFLDTALIDRNAAALLVDDRPILDKLNLKAAAIWRKAYTDNFTKRLVAAGIPLFE